jgi:glycolate oxidase FAD binding subunit
VEQIPNAAGQVSLFQHGDRSSEIFHPPSAVSKKLHQRLKHSFDANGVFNPGRLYSWL